MKELYIIMFINLANGNGGLAENEYYTSKKKAKKACRRLRERIKERGKNGYIKLNIVKITKSKKK